MRPNRARARRTLLLTLGKLTLGAAIGWLTGTAHLWIAPPERTPHWQLLAAYAFGFAVLAVLGDLWLRSAPKVEVSAPPDPTGRFGKIVGFVLGALFGLFLAIGMVTFVVGFTNPPVTKLLFVICIVVCGMLSMKYGNDFWQGMSG